MPWLAAGRLTRLFNQRLHPTAAADTAGLSVRIDEQPLRVSRQLRAADVRGLAMNPIRLCCIFVVSLTAGCGSVDQDPHWRVGAYRVGQREADLRRDVGPPTQERSVNSTDKDEFCSGTEAVRELMYDMPSQGAAKRVRDLFRMGPISSYGVCIDGAGRIVRTSLIEID